MSDLINLGALWLNEKDGKKYMSGYLGDARLLVFKNDHKDNDKAPDYRVLIGKGKKQQEYEAGKAGDGNQGGSRGGRQDGGDDVPF